MSIYFLFELSQKFIFKTLIWLPDAINGLNLKFLKVITNPENNWKCVQAIYSAKQC